MQISKIYQKLSISGKILLFISLFLICVILFHVDTRREGFTQTEKFVYKENYQIYDNFYASIYDYLVFNNVKNDYEVGAIINQTHPTQESIIVDIGCGTGHHVNALTQQGLQVFGIDISPAMIKKAKEYYPGSQFERGDGLDKNILEPNSVTHILCLYFTVYSFRNKQLFFENCIEWLIPGGYLIVHLVDRERFDPILPPGNPLYIVSPQKYAKKRITHTKIKFDGFDYESDFQLEPEQDSAIFEEKFRFPNGNTRKNQHNLFIEPISVIVDIAQNSGFIVHGKIDLLKCAYEHQYLYIFMKPG
jgi:SAM-dependent methyltransferase